MSDKGSESAKNKGNSNILKWSLIVLTVLVLEATSVVGAVKVTEMRGKADTSKLQNIYDKLSSQQKQINMLEKLPSSISAIGQQSGSNTQNLNALIENFNQLNEEAGNNKVPYMTEKMEKLNHRMEIIEENSRGEMLILNLALIIKENVLYQRPFTQEADLLSEISKNDADLKSYVDVINSYKNQQIKNNIQLAQQYADLAQYFSFSNTKEEKTASEKQGAVAKSVELLKGTVAKLNFDKVVVLKKDKPTDQQQALINKLNDLVQNYNYNEALDILAEHNELECGDKNALEAWKKDVSDKLNVENALSKIITEQLSALRQDIKNKTIQMPSSINEETIDEIKESENTEEQLQREEKADD